VRLYCQDPLWFTVELRIKPREIPELRLTSDEDAGMLGMTSWVRTAEIMETSVAFDESSTVFGASGSAGDAVQYEAVGA
jgi:predicted component of type VI protein secretion system